MCSLYIAMGAYSHPLYCSCLVVNVELFMSDFSTITIECFITFSKEGCNAYRGKPPRLTLCDLWTMPSDLVKARQSFFSSSRDVGNECTKENMLMRNHPIIVDYDVS